MLWLILWCQVLLITLSQLTSCSVLVLLYLHCHNNSKYATVTHSLSQLTTLTNGPTTLAATEPTRLATGPTSLQLCPQILQVCPQLLQLGPQIYNWVHKSTTGPTIPTYGPTTPTPGSTTPTMAYNSYWKWIQNSSPSWAFRCPSNGPQHQTGPQLSQLAP